LREYEFLDLIDHPNIIKAKNLIREEDKIYIVMEYLDGFDLFQLVKRRGRLSDEKCRNLFRQIVGAIDYLHQHLVHRDIKLENILVGKPKSDVKIIDFGHTSEFSYSTPLVTYYGTLMYSSPEALEEIPHLGPSSDIWSLGVILYTMAAGRMPFKGFSPASILKTIKSRPLVYPGNFTTTLVDLLNQIFVVDHTKRIKMYEIRNHSW
ncbi:kinase-like domain-containing protein, partial [Phycomyces nitens]